MAKRKVQPVDDGGLSLLGLHKGEAIRFKKSGDAARWTLGKIHSAEKDGSITIHDENGAARSLRPERIEIQRVSSRGRTIWQNLAELLATAQQLTLFAPPNQTRR
jgi:hypothetical protein